MNKAIGWFLAAISIVASAPASAVIVGRIDFGVQGKNSPNMHLETATLAQTFVNGNGQNATAYGFITTVNGDNTYCSDGSGNCGLYYVAQFNNSQNFSSSYVEFTSATVSVFFHSGSPLNLLGNDSPTNVATIQGMNGENPWVTLAGHNNLGGISDLSAVLNGVSLLTGNTLSGANFGLFDVDVTGPGDASVVSFLDTNLVLDAVGGSADIVFTSSFNNSVLNPKDVANGFAAGCENGTASAGAWCYQGTALLAGNTGVVPEAEAYAMLLSGLGLLSFATRRKKQ